MASFSSFSLKFSRSVDIILYLVRRDARSLASASARALVSSSWVVTEILALFMLAIAFSSSSICLLRSWFSTWREKPSPQVFLDYEKQRGYNLHTVKNYGKTLEKTGFSKVVALDKTNLMVNIMKIELKKFYEIKDSYIKKFSQKDFDDIEGGWKE